MMRVGIASDHGGFNLKGQVAESLRGAGLVPLRTARSPGPSRSPAACFRTTRMLVLMFAPNGEKVSTGKLMMPRSLAC